PRLTHRDAPAPAASIPRTRSVVKSPRDKFGRTSPPACPGTPGSALIQAMTVIKINAITVPEDAGDELARRFAARAGAVDGQAGFEGFELLRPTDDRRQGLGVPR